ncbi:MAG TPA: SH3 domain-containing protein, partial [Clostridia bacterium]|nr:SH3 domain-containing protein [Clostridia bacterium]
MGRLLAKKRIMLFKLLLVIFILTIFIGNAFAAEGKAVVTGSIVNIRSSPNLEAKVVAKVAKGEELDVLGEEGEWYRVKLNKGTVGWIAGSLVEVKDQAVMTGVKVKVDGRLVSFDVEPYIDAQSRTMVPIRFVATELGSQVFWKEAEQEVVITGNDRIIQLWIGQALAKVNGREVAMDTVPVLKDGRTMVPLRFVSDNLGVEVAWDGPARTVLLQRVKTPGIEGQTGTDTTARMAVVTGNVVNIRSGPGQEHGVLTQVVKGDALTVLGQSGDWF